jgi:hypothetical protein
VFLSSTVKNPNLAHPLVGSPHGGGFRSEALTLPDDVQTGLACALAVQTRISRKKPPLRREQSHFTSTFCSNGMCWRGISCCFLAIVTGLRCVIYGDSGSSCLIGLCFAATGYVKVGGKSVREIVWLCLRTLWAVIGPCVLFSVEFVALSTSRRGCIRVNHCVYNGVSCGNYRLVLLID